MSEQLAQNHSDCEPGVAVDLEDRFWAINSLARIYAQSARARGLGMAINNPRENEKLSDRYGSSSKVRRISRKATIKGEIGLRDVPGLVKRIMRSDDLAKAGFSQLEIEDGELDVLCLRQEIGVQAGREKRQQLLDGLNPGSPMADRPPIEPLDSPLPRTVSSGV